MELLKSSHEWHELKPAHTRNWRSAASVWRARMRRAFLRCVQFVTSGAAFAFACQGAHRQVSGEIAGTL